MSINLFKKFYSPNTVKKIYFYLYREINKKVARKQYKIIQRVIRRAWPMPFVAWCRAVWIISSIARRPAKDAYRMFKAVKKTTTWRPLFGASIERGLRFKQQRYHTMKELRGMLRMNKVKGRSKLKTKREIIVALMKM